MFVTATSSFPFCSPARSARFSGTPLELVPRLLVRSRPLLEGRRVVRLRRLYTGRSPFVVADEGGSRCVGEGEEEAFSTCLRGEVVMPFFDFARGSWVDGGEAWEMDVFVLEGGGASASDEFEVEVAEDEELCSGFRVDLIVRRSFGRGDDVAGSCGSSAALSTTSSSEDIVSSRWNLSYPSFLYPSAYRDL